jgi:hypothetical protein
MSPRRDYFRRCRGFSGKREKSCVIAAVWFLWRLAGAGSVRVSAENSGNNAFFCWPKKGCFRKILVGLPDLLQLALLL